MACAELHYQGSETERGVGSIWALALCPRRVLFSMDSVAAATKPLARLKVVVQGTLASSVFIAAQRAYEESSC
jgi:hypothetical protein